MLEKRYKIENQKMLIALKLKSPLNFLWKSISIFSSII